jgi:hypothetical protein
MGLRNPLFLDALAQRYPSPRAEISAQAREPKP